MFSSKHRCTTGNERQQDWTNTVGINKLSSMQEQLASLHLLIHSSSAHQLHLSPSWLSLPLFFNMTVHVDLRNKHLRSPGLRLHETSNKMQRSHSGLLTLSGFKSTKTANISEFQKIKPQGCSKAVDNRCPISLQTTNQNWRFLFFAEF